MSKLSDNIPVGITLCERNGLSGNCGLDCEIFQNFECPNLTLEEHCKEKEEAGECRNAKCDLYLTLNCKKYEYKEQLTYRLQRLKFSAKEIFQLID